MTEWDNTKCKDAMKTRNRKRDMSVKSLWETAMVTGLETGQEKKEELCLGHSRMLEDRK